MRVFFFVFAFVVAVIGLNGAQKRQKPCLPESLQGKGLVLAGSKEDLLSGEMLAEIEGLCIQGVELPGSESELVNRLWPLYFDQPVDAHSIEDIRREIYAYFQENGDPFILVTVPSQNINDGVLQFLVIHSQVGEIKVKGNRWVPPETLIGYLHQKSGDPVDIKKLHKGIDFINRNPFRYADLVFSPGERTGTTDIEILTRVRNEVRFYVGCDNTGVPTTGRQRLLSGVNWGNAFGLDHVFNFQYTGSYNFQKLNAYMVQYLGLLPWDHLFTIYGGYSTVRARPHLPSNQNTGNFGQASFRYEIPLAPSNTISQQISFGFDYKNTNNTVLFSELFTNFSGKVNLFQLVFEYNLKYERSDSDTDFYVGAFGSPGEWLPDQSNTAYSSLRPGAENAWFYGRFFLTHLHKIPVGMALFVRLQGQLASTRLLPSEQIGIGGFESVRGYDERQLNYDAGLLGRVELRSPNLPVAKWLGACKAHDGLQFLAFLDVGGGGNYQLIPGEPSHDYLLGIGPGLRYTYDPYMALRFDWGFKLHQQTVFTSGSNEVHFGLTFSY